MSGSLPFNFEVAWVNVSVANGTTTPGRQSNISVTFNSAGISAPNTVTGKLCVASNDPSRPLVSVPLTLGVIYDFQGFFGSVKNPPVINKINSGSTVAFSFSLSGNQGLNIFPAGSPSSVEIDCNTLAPNGAAEPAHTGGGGNGLSYSALTDRYAYRWRTQGDWAVGSCREFTMGLNDGTTHRALFRIK